MRTTVFFSVLILRGLKRKLYKGPFFHSSAFIEDKSGFSMDELREKYAKWKGIPLDEVPSCIIIKGKKELEYILGPEIEEIEHAGEGSLENLVEYERKNGKIECKISMHHGDKNNDSYYGLIFSMDSNHNDLKENVAYGEKRKIGFIGKDGKEVAEKFKEFIKLEEAKECEKIQEQFQRPAFAIGLPFYVAKIEPPKKESEEYLNENLEGYSIFFEVKPENEQGFHARPSSQVIIKANKYGKKVALIKGGQRSQYNSPMGMMALYVSKGMAATIEVNGTDEKSWKCAAEIYSLVENKFGED